MATKLGPSYLFSFSAVCVLLICCWASLVESNPVLAENNNQLDRDEVAFEAGEPLTDEEFNSDVQGKAVSIDNQGTQPWQHQPDSGLVGGDLLPEDAKNGNKNAAAKWPNAQVPYVISSSFSAKDRQVIASAMAMYHQKTCIRFVARGTQKDYVKIVRSRGCWSVKGRAGGVQELSIGDGCVSRATVVHELMHALGFDHEHQRPDQKKFIIVKYDNIQNQHRQWFEPLRPDAVNSIGRYDIKSVMHYNAYSSFAVDTSKPTMVTKTGGTTMGNEYGLTAMDVEKLKTFYCK
ncbi:astacin-like metalloprotease toxin 5 [Daphnia magna]|uniref:astacin-like metalloprotease toxin 5 n=1 Tax=Daphnia magna TaxID=35525 RepID=UPI001E1BAA00|nr:astacin-like metalloprotease toxin 5 [Daphnia magna]